MKSLTTEIILCAVSSLMKNVSALKTRAIKKTTRNIPNHFRLIRKVASLDRMALSNIAGAPDNKVAKEGTQPSHARMPKGGVPVKMFAEFSRIFENAAKAII
ncbi:MAG: hypothetical protein OK452_03905, partial [Thaumarchaeota archaeon]|nr:hypothetical protein [Nitrososphaerota archaeon]